MSKNQMKEKVGASKIIGLIHDRPELSAAKTTLRDLLRDDKSLERLATTTSLC